jgi:hypothetical protein
MRYGGGFTALVASSEAASFLFDMLSSDDNDATQAQEFLADNPLFPAARGEAATDALEKLDGKLGLLYRYERATAGGARGWQAVRRFTLIAPHDCEAGEPQTWYDVHWDALIEDLRSQRSPFFYSDASSRVGLRTRRNLKALVEFDYAGDFAALAR